MRIGNMNDAEFGRLVRFMQERYGINLSRKRVLVEGRLGLMLKQRGYKTYTDYINHLECDNTGEEVAVLVSKLTTNFTFFLREDAHYRFLTERVLPAWRVPQAGGYQLWSAACSSGEEPYTLAMVLANYFGYGVRKDIKIVASDISENVLARARAGVYSLDQIDKLPADWIPRFFTQTKDAAYEVKAPLKAMVDYKYFNLNDTRYWQQQYDIVFCRNVMIYFDAPTKQRLIERLYQSVKPGGYLFIGMSETLVTMDTKFTYMQPSIYRKEL